MYELGKYVTEQLIIKYTSNDDIEAPQDFKQDDQIHLNAEPSEWCFLFMLLWAAFDEAFEYL